MVDTFHIYIVIVVPIIEFIITMQIFDSKIFSNKKILSHSIKHNAISIISIHKAFLHDSHIE